MQRLAWPSQRMQCVSRAGPEPDLRAFQAVTNTEQHVFVADFETIKIDLAMPAMLFGPHDLDAAHDAPARLVAVVGNAVSP